MNFPNQIALKGFLTCTIIYILLICQTAVGQKQFTHPTENLQRKKHKKTKNPLWKERAKKLKLSTAGLISDILWGKIPEEIIKEAGGKTRPKHLKWPVPGGRFGRGFGSGKGGRHKAIDIVAPIGTTVRAAGAGLVVWANWKNGFGKTIIIVHPGGWVTLYAHLSEYLVKPGMKVRARQKIARVGNTGISRGPHLHFMFYDNGILRDPAPLFHPSYPHPPHLPPMPFMGYTVKKGDTPERIAKKFNMEVETLLNANGMKRGQKLQKGWRIIIPKRIKARQLNKGYYIVKKGDTLSAIAVLYDVSYKELKKINNLEDENFLKPGMKILLPEGVYEGKAITIARQEQKKKLLYKKYKIKAGENLTLIAKKFKTNLNELIKVNKIKNPDKVTEGMEILVPKKRKKTSKKQTRKEAKPKEEEKTTSTKEQKQSLL